MNIKREDCKFSTNVMISYCNKILDYSMPNGTSIYQYVCDALSKDGYPIPLNISPRGWVFNNWEHIGGKLKRPKKIQKQHIETNKKHNKKPVKKHKTFVQTDDFLQSYAWRKLRMEAILKYGRKCQCCGSTPETGAIINVDHIKPRKLFPQLALELSNLQVLCHECNHGKGNWDQTDWR